MSVTASVLPILDRKTSRVSGQACKMSVLSQKRNLVLVIEDTASLANVYRTHLETAGFECVLLSDIKSAQSHHQDKSACAIILSLDAAGDDHLSSISGLSSQWPGAAIVVIAANASINDAVDAVRAGAWDYMVKPVSRNRLITTLKNASTSAPHLQTAEAGIPVRRAPAPHATMIGSSRAITGIRRQIEAIAPSNAPVFITGESGTGKELCAQAIHDFSARKDKPFIALNCGAIPHDLMESEIFGHLKGAFTGAISDREGAAAAADGGTLFLDEICELGLALQIKLLRFLQTGTIQPVGSAHTRKVNIRILCATNRNPQAEVAQGRFREDLYFRLHVLPVHLMPLRERGSDVIELARTFLSSFAEEENRRFAGLGECTIEILSSYRWPGNIRELQNVIRQAVVLNDGGLLTAEMLPDHISIGQTHSAAAGLEHAGRQLWQIEREVIEAAICSFAGSVPKAADALGISPSTIYRKRETWAAKPA